MQLDKSKKKFDLFRIATNENGKLNLKICPWYDISGLRTDYDCIVKAQLVSKLRIFILDNTLMIIISMFG